MAPCRAASDKQLDVLLEFVEENAQLILCGIGGGPYERQCYKKKWDMIARKLNALGSGCCKTPTEWKRYWTLLKSRTKHKAGNLQRAATGTGGSTVPLTSMEKRVIGIIGKVPLVRTEPEARIPINIPDLPSKLDRSHSPVEEIIIEEHLSEELLSEEHLSEKHLSEEHLSEEHLSRSSNDIAGVKHFPQWAIDIEYNRLESHKKIFEEMQGIKKAIQEQTKGINRIGDLLSVLIERN